MDEGKNLALRVGFDLKLKKEFHGTKITSDAGRELDDVLGLMETASRHLEDYRTGKNTYTRCWGCFANPFMEGVPEGGDR